MPVATATRRFLRSSLVDLMVGPHGIDRYLELIRPEITVRDARARIVSVERQTARSVTLTVAPNAAWSGFDAGQFVKVGVEIAGVRRTRTYSPACSSLGDDGLLEFTVTAHPEGLVSRHLQRLAATGGIIHLGEAQGTFTLPERRPGRLVLISGGSGITPVLSMLRTLLDEGHDGELAFVHFARTEQDWLYRTVLDRLARRHPNLAVEYHATRASGARLDPPTAERLSGGGGDETAIAVCGPPRLIDAAHELWGAERVLSETFTPPTLTVSGAAASGTVHFTRSGRTAAIAEGTLLEQAEAAGLTPDFGCRMGICHTCTCRKRAGAVQNIRTGEVSDEEDEDIQLCISVPAGDVALEI
jgi:ferredoxin-NADP reductase